MTEQQARSSMSYLQSMLSKPTAVASAEDGGDDGMGEDWQPYASAASAKSDPPAPSVAAANVAKVQVVAAAER
jgi:hypothetical protein